MGKKLLRTYKSLIVVKFANVGGNSPVKLFELKVLQRQITNNPSINLQKPF